MSNYIDFFAPGDLQMVIYAVPAFCYCHHIQRNVILQAQEGQPRRIVLNEC